jgi:ABC-type Fe3+ transport system substrate-binding protein
MSDEPIEHVERQLGGLRPATAPRAMRAAVLADVHRELRSSRWDRRLARVAAVLLIVGVGLNVAIGMKSLHDSAHSVHVVRGRPRQSLVDTAVIIAQATDAQTGSQYARQLAAMIGQPLSDSEAAVVDAAVQYSAKDSNGSKG